MIESNRPQAWRLISIDEVDSVELMSLRVLPTVPIYDIRVDTDRSLQSIAALIAPEDIHVEAKAAALADDRSLNSLVVRAVRTYLEKEKIGRK